MQPDMRRWTWIVVCICLAGAVFADWEDQDVPEGLAPAGVATESPPGTWTVDGAGEDIWGATDGCHYLYEENIVSGDFALACHIVSLSGSPSTWAKAGLMARTGVDVTLR